MKTLIALTIRTRAAVAAGRVQCVQRVQPVSGVFHQCLVQMLGGVVAPPSALEGRTR